MKRFVLTLAVAMAICISGLAQESGGRWVRFVGLDSGYRKPYDVALGIDYTWDDQLFLGGGVETVWFINFLVRPFADIRYAFKPEAASPFVEASAGYVFSSGADLNATLGYRFPTKKSDSRHAWWVGAGVGYWAGCDGTYYPVKIEFSF